jgi:general secretion pathway protein G
MKRYYTDRYKRQGGFSFLEIIVVVAILSLLATLVVVNVAGNKAQADIDAARLQIAEYSKALELYKIDNGFYPTTDQGLEALIHEPESEPRPRKWKPYLNTDVIAKDPWGNDYIYIQPGIERNFDLFSYGPDGVEGEDDITNWNTDKESGNYKNK